MDSRGRPGAGARPGRRRVGRARPGLAHVRAGPRPFLHECGLAHRHGQRRDARTGLVVPDRRRGERLPRGGRRRGLRRIVGRVLLRARRRHRRAQVAVPGRLPRLDPADPAAVSGRAEQPRRPRRDRRRAHHLVGRGRGRQSLLRRRQDDVLPRRGQRRAGVEEGDLREPRRGRLRVRRRGSDPHLVVARRLQAQGLHRSHARRRERLPRRDRHARRTDRATALAVRGRSPARRERRPDPGRPHGARPEPGLRRGLVLRGDRRAEEARVLRYRRLRLRRGAAVSRGDPRTPRLERPAALGLSSAPGRQLRLRLRRVGERDRHRGEPVGRRRRQGRDLLRAGSDHAEPGRPARLAVARRLRRLLGRLHRLDRLRRPAGVRGDGLRRARQPVRRLRSDRPA